jgi:proteasome lid subunit RPN8/RPN11
MTSSEVTVAVYHVRSDGDIAVARLAADGIVARLAVDDEGGLNPGFFAHYGVRVVVGAVDLEDAYQSLGIEQILVPFQVADAMFKHAGWAFPEEACGLVAFDDASQPVLALCLTNVDHAGDRFTIAPDEQFGAITLSEQLGYSIGAVFHSHTRSEAIPSEFDVEGGADPEWLHFIVGPVAGRRPLLRAYRIVDGDVTEVKVAIGQ